MQETPSHSPEEVEGARNEAVQANAQLEQVLADGQKMQEGEPTGGRLELALQSAVDKTKADRERKTAGEELSTKEAALRGLGQSENVGRLQKRYDELRASMKEGWAAKLNKLADFNTDRVAANEAAILKIDQRHQQYDQADNVGDILADDLAKKTEKYGGDGKYSRPLFREKFRAFRKKIVDSPVRKWMSFRKERNSKLSQMRTETALAYNTVAKEIRTMLTSEEVALNTMRAEQRKAATNLRDTAQGSFDTATAASEVATGRLETATSDPAKASAELASYDVAQTGLGNVEERQDIVGANREKITGMMN